MVKRFIFSGILLIAGFFLGFVLGSDWHNAPALDFFELREGGQKFTNPLLETELGEELLANEIKPFKTRIEQLVKEKIAHQEISYISVYFRDMNNGPWFGINEREKFIPASLLKVPIMIAVLKQAEADPGLLEKKILFQKSAEKALNYYSVAKTLQEGQEYSINELLEMMIVNSDNYAKDLLVGNIPREQVEKVFERLGLEKPNFRADEEITVKAYATFFRILFNSSYLNREMSEKALELLSRSQFRHGLPAGVPAEIDVAHKFGEWWPEPNASKQLHDCGIIYFPRKPYLLCVMTRGENFDTLATAIAEVSKTTYDEVYKQQRD